MTDVSVEEPTEKTASPAEASGRAARPFSLSLSLSTPEPSQPSPGGPASFRDEPDASPDEPVLTVVEEDPSPAPSTPSSLSPMSPVSQGSPASSTSPAPSASSVSSVSSVSSASSGASDEPLPPSPGDDADVPETPPQSVSVISAAPPAPAPSPVAGAVVKGRIKVADEVVEKVAALAALEVAGVAELCDEAALAAETVRHRAGSGPGVRRGPRGVSAHVQDRTAAVDVTIVTEYGHVVMDVANEVKTNVARTISRMLGMRVVEVNVTVDDVRLPGETGRTTPA
ncbi:Asp23/Gls24 family envelope stress response protein [Streptosporangium sp. NPDC050855]|uniref:Asp23/Gls24 family envelope stress response protein n=1 Tax=Streptosporangium sp. NPDC050855 TaxID=3366194 RepID=UPI0037B51E33